MEEQVKRLEKEIELLKERNARVEADKAWETSWFRVLLITAIIYVVALKLLIFMGSQNYFLNALVPAVGYLLSVQSLLLVKKWWIKKYGKK